MSPVSTNVTDAVASVTDAATNVALAASNVLESLDQETGVSAMDILEVASKTTDTVAAFAAYIGILMAVVTLALAAGGFYWEHVAQKARRENEAKAIAKAVEETRKGAIDAFKNDEQIGKRIVQEMFTDLKFRGLFERYAKTILENQLREMQEEPSPGSLWSQKTTIDSDGEEDSDQGSTDV